MNTGIEESIASVNEQGDGRLYPKAFPGFAVRIQFSILLLLILLIATELISGALLSITHDREDGGRTHSYYRNKPWAAEYFREFDRSQRHQYRPYVLWRHAPFEGKYINVDEEGVRRTVNPTCSPQAFQIWAFGASTLWGVGARDDQTIPSILSQEYARTVGPLCVTNFGEPAWVSNQNLIQLQIALKHAPHPPDLVLFYDGLADVIAVYQNRNADAHFSLNKIRDKVEGAQYSGFRSNFAYLRGAATWHLITDIMSEVARADSLKGKPSRNLDNLAAMTVENYRANMKAVEGLSAQYGFRYISFWEPMVLSGNKPLTKAERHMLDDIEHETPGLADLCRRTYALMFSVQNPHVMNIADTFDRTENDTYMAVGHINPDGNHQVALRILDVLRKSGTEPVLPH
jgi:hypothetical protein